MLNPKSNLFETTAFRLLVLLLPTQLALHLWPDWSLVFGIRVDYLSPTIYLTDILTYILFVSWLFTNPVIKISKKLVYWIIYLTIFATLNVIFSEVWQVSAFRWFKIVEYSFVVYYIATKWQSIKETFFTSLSIACVYTFLLSVAQVINNGTLGGIFYWIGERSFDLTTPGIALANFFGTAIIRPYATFPHPNVLGGFSLVSLILIISIEKKSLIHKLGIITSVLSLILSFSQGVLVGGAVVFFLYLVKLKNYKKLLLILLFTFSVFLPIFSWQTLKTNKDANPGLFYTSERSIEQRLTLARSAGEIFSNNPIYGSGIGTFIVGAKEKTLQPAHNIILLVLSELGIIGVVLLFILLIKLLGMANNVFALSLFAILVTGFVDHYWITLQQGSLFFAILLGYGFNNLRRRGIKG